jgi:hypothetical protein
MASARIVEVGLTAYGWDSLPTQTARMRAGSTFPARARALRAASMEMVTTSSSGPATAFSVTGVSPSPPVQMRATSAAGSR